jgi:hypothetical protein
MDSNISSGQMELSHLSNVDDLLCAEIAQRTQDNEQFWSSPKRNMRDSAHAFFQYPGMMIPAVQRNLIAIITDVQPGVRRIIDPFVGAGTMYRGLDCYGQDINPLAVLLSLSKIGPFFYNSLVRRTQRVIQLARDDTSEEIDIEFPNLYKWFRKDVAVELSRLKRAIQTDNTKWARRFMWVTLAETVRLTSNDRTSTYKLHIRATEEIANRELSAMGIFSGLIKQNLDDLLKFKKDLDQAGYVQRGRYTGKAEVALGDTTKGVILPDGEANQLYDLLVTSAPYGDNTSTITYGQHSYLPLQWIDLIDIAPEVNRSFLRTTQEIDRRSLGGRRPRKLEEQIEKLSPKSEALARTFQALTDKPRDRASRVAAFYLSFEETLDHIVNSLAVNAYMIWTVGNRHVGNIEVPNDKILIGLLEKRDVHLVTQVERHIYQKRMPPRNQISRTMSHERILIFRKSRITGDRQ